jgi:predicted phage tail protein
VLQNIASVFRAVTFWSGSSLSVSADMPADPVYVYTPANVLNGKFTYQSTPKKQRFTTALVTWNDPSDFYRSKQHYVQHDGGLARYGIVPTSITAMGCTSEAQAHRAGMWALESA